MADFSGFQRRLDKAKAAIIVSGLKDGLVIHHDEADGLCSGALTRVALEKLGINVRLICLDKLYPEVVKDIEAGPQRIIAYSDIGSAHMDWLSSLNKSQNLILTLDHHDTKEVADPLVHNLNPELYGYSGEKDACSATIAHIFTKTVDPSLTSFAPLAIIGSQEIPGETQGLNRIPLEDAEANHRVVRTPRGGLKLELGGESVSPNRAATVLNVLGSVGYYQHGPETGIKSCLNGFDSETLRQADEYEKQRKTANQRMLSAIREGGLAQMKNIQWFHAKDNYKGMSGKVVGSFCSYLSYQRLVNPMKYLIGMMNVPTDIPGWGKLSKSIIKVSGRVSQPLAKLIETGKRPPLSKILLESCERVGGFGDGHTVAASGVFPVGAEENFLGIVDRLIESDDWIPGR